MDCYKRRTNRRFWFFTLFTLGLLWWTNPDRDAYVEHAARAHEAEIIAQCRTSGPIESWICESLLRFPGFHDALRDHLDEHTQVTDYWFASVYHTHLHELHRRYVTLGMLGHFVEVRSDEAAH